MNYNADKPIKTEEEDLLGRSFFSKQLAKALYECDASDGLVIGLFGEWGSGKTSVLNMTMNEIKNMGEESKNKPLIVTFSPWNYSDKDNLISLFFRNLINNLDMPSNNKIKRKIGKVLTDYADCLDALSVLSPLGGILVNILKPIIKTQGTNLMEVPNLDSTKEKLETILKESNQKIIVVIDDIDRLTNSQIRDIFHLAKQVGNFPNIVYILSMDREIVCRALKEIHNIDGHEYLEKIIQIPFEIPRISKSKVHKYLFNQLDKIINDISNDTIIDDSYWGRIFVNCVSPYIDNLRDINRLTNIFKFKYRALYQEVSVEDMIGITALEVLEPKLYKWIYSNKDILCNSNNYKFFKTNEDAIEYRNRYYDEFKEMSISPEKSIRCVSTMFPVFAKEINEYQGSYQSDADNKKKMRICDAEKFDIYFRHDLDSVEVSRTTIKDWIYIFNENELVSSIDEINDKGNIIYFLEEVLSLIDDIPCKRINLIVSVIFSSQWNFKGETNAGLFTRTAYDLAIDLVEELLHRIRIEQERFELLYSILNDMDKNRVGAITIILYRIKLFYERNSEEVNTKAIISLEQLLKLEEKYLVKIKSIIESEESLSIEMFSVVFRLWGELDKQEALEYFNKISTSTINTLKFICIFATRRNGTHGSRWSFDISGYEQYISKDEIYDVVKRLRNIDLLEFTEIEKLKLATFVLNYQMHELYSANEEQAQELVEQWERNGIKIEN